MDPVRTQLNEDIMSNDYTRRWAGDALIDTLILGGGTRLRFLRAGTGAALLLMHTLRTQLDYFQQLIPSLARHFTVHAVDLPGMGWSGSRVVTLADTGHFASLERPEAVLRILLDDTSGEALAA